jgi:hypothetical protein
MMLFAEKVALAAVVPLCVLLAANPMKFDLQQQISGAVFLPATGYFIAHTLEKRAAPEAPASIFQPVQDTSIPAPAPQIAEDCSSNVNGDNNKVSVNCGEKPK